MTLTELRDAAVAASHAAIAANEESSRVNHAANPAAWQAAQDKASAARKRHIAANDAFLDAAFAEVA